MNVMQAEAGKPLQQEAQYLQRELVDNWLALEMEMSPLYSLAGILPSLVIYDSSKEVNTRARAEAQAA